MWYIYEREFCSAIYKSEIMLFIGKLMQLKINVLSEKISQNQKDKYHILFLKCGIHKQREGEREVEEEILKEVERGIKETIMKYMWHERRTEKLFVGRNGPVKGRLRGGSG